MIRLWIAVALLAGSWLLGLDYFYPAITWAWLAAVGAAVVLMGTTLEPAKGADDDASEKDPRRRSLETTAMVLFLPAVWFAPWPYRAAPLLIVLGLAIRLLPVRKRWTDCLAYGAVTAGVVMLVQALAVELYTLHTAWSHELTWPLPNLLAGIATLLGIDASAEGSTIVMHSMRQTHRLGATWELLFDPATVLFFVGGLTTLAMTVCAKTPDGHRWSAWIRGFRTLTLIVLAWLPLRAGLMIGLYMHRVLRADPDLPLHTMDHFFSPWMLLALLVVPVLLAWRFVRLGTTDEGPMTEGEGDVENGNPIAEDAEPSSSPSAPISIPLIASLIGLGVALATIAIYWSPVGARREGRVMVVERHSEWEPTTRAYDTTWFGEPSGYNYAAIYDYLGQYYQMSRLLENDKIDDRTLAQCDVLVIKTPTARYAQPEVDAVLRFVQQGGGLLLVGDHTNFERSSTILNDIARRMGFVFRDDLLFGFGESPYDQRYTRPTVPHPVVQNVPPMDFAVSCSIDPGRGSGRAVIASTGLWSMGPEYHHENYHPFPQHRPEMRYGAFVQVWATAYGQGRALAFTDSTIFSNFCVFQPGKAELMLGMVEWLNHGGPPVNPRPWLLLLAVPALAVGLWEARGRCDLWLVLLAAGACGWVAASLAVAGAHRWAMPTPERLRPERCVVIDRTVSTVPLSEGPDTRGEGDGYGLLEQWIARTGCFTVRKDGSEAFSGDALVIICPNRSVTEQFRNDLIQFVENGGKLLVIDSPENVGSTANSLLWPFKMSIHHQQAWKGKLSTSTGLPLVDIAAANEISGGRSVAKLDKLPVAATGKFGQGSVMAIGFGSLWNDQRMGEHWMLEPDAATKTRYDLLFALLQSFLDDKPLSAIPPATSEKPADEPPPLEESGPAEL